MGGGFQSYAPAPLEYGCQAGFIPPGCKGTVGVRLAVGANVIIDPFQVLRVIAIIDAGSAATASITDLVVDGQPLFPRTATAPTDPGLGLLVNLTPALYDAGGNPLPPMPNINNTHPLTIVSAVAVVHAYRVYLGNPANAGEPLGDNDAGSAQKQ
jgi:hypothetical protein